jgi:hypothetical protein
MRKRIGKLQRQCRRAFWAANVSELPTSALVAWCYVRSPRPLATWQREAICRRSSSAASSPGCQLGRLLCGWLPGEPSFRNVK